MSKVINLIDSDDDLDAPMLPQKQPKTETVLNAAVADQLPKKTQTRVRKTTSKVSFKQKAFNVATTTSTPASIKTVNKIQSDMYTSLLQETSSLSTTTASNPVVATNASSTTTINSSSAATATATTNTIKSGRHRSRKTQHRAICHSPDIQFVTIDLAKEEELATQSTAANESSASDTLPADKAQYSTTTPGAIGVAAANNSVGIITFKQSPSTTTGESLSKKDANRKTVKTRVITPKGEVLNTKAKQNEIDQLIHKEIDRFLARTEIISAIQDVADNRVRTNYLLTLYGMHEMAFIADTHLEVYKTQFNDRLKARESRLLQEELQQSVRDKQNRQLADEEEKLKKRIRFQQKRL